jgi:hypothetical protein
MSYEYKVVPAPTRGLKARGVKTAEDRFAHALESAINELAASGWEYLRTDTLPSEQREGLMGKTTVYQNMLVFRRAKKSTQATASLPVLQAPPPVGPARSGEERLAEKRALATPTPLSSPKPPSPDVAAE